MIVAPATAYLTHKHPWPARTTPFHFELYDAVRAYMTAISGAEGDTLFRLWHGEKVKSLPFHSLASSESAVPGI